MSSWEIEYSSKLQTAGEALRAVQSDMRVYIQPGCAEPETLVEALLKRAPFVHNVEVVHLLTSGMRGLCGAGNGRSLPAQRVFHWRKRTRKR